MRRYEEFTVINNHGIVREVRPEELRGKRNSSSGRAVALDVQGNQIRVGDTVKVAEGPHKGRVQRLNACLVPSYFCTVRL